MNDTPWWLDAIFVAVVPTALFICSGYLILLAITDWMM